MLKKIQQQSKHQSAKEKRDGLFKLTVGKKLFIIILCCVLIPVLVTGFTALNVANSIITDNAGTATTETIQQTSAKIEATLTTYEQIVTQIITNLRLHDQLFSATSVDRDTFERLTAQRDVTDTLGQITYADNYITSISIISVDPSVGSFTTASTAIDAIDREQDWFQRIATGEQQMTWLHTKESGYTGNVSGQSFALSRLFRTTYAQTFVVIVEIDQKLLHDQVKDIQISPSSNVYLTNSNNELLHAEESALVGSTAELPLPEAVGLETVQHPDGGDYIVASHYSAKAGWYVVGTAPVSELVEDTVYIQQVVIIIVLIAGVAAIIVSTLIARSMGGPLRRLERLMIEGAKGNLNVRTDFKNRDEIGQVGKSFNEMMEQIRGLVQQTNQSASDVLVTAQELSGSAKETSQAAREISEATEQIASGASTLATEAERGNELVMDLGKQLQHVVTANRSMGEVASDVHKVSEQGTGYMAQLTDKTKTTEEMTRRMVEKVDQLKESTASIRNLLDMLTQITQQTNILALNASIEASRSGAAGRGFMVIAGEIRKLADESRKSIDVVAEMIEQIQGDIDETVSVMTEAYPMFQEQITAVMDADTIFNNVRERMTMLVEQADQVTEAIELLEKGQQVLNDTMSSVSAVSEESSAISEEVASSSASQLNTSDTLVNLAVNLENLSSALSESLKKFKI